MGGEEFSKVDKRGVKLLKIVGNKERHVEKLIEGLECDCGGQGEFKKIVVLLMDKIYKLREERNELRN